MTETEGNAATGSAKTSPKDTFYRRLGQVLTEGGFDKHMALLCKPFIVNTSGPSWWVSQPSIYFRILLAGYLEGIESEDELCWRLDESLVLRRFVGFAATADVADAQMLARLREPLLPLVHSEAFDALVRIVEKAALLGGPESGLDPTTWAPGGPLADVVARLRSNDHQNYWRRLTRMPGASWAPRAQPTVSPRTSARPSGGSDAKATVPPFVLWMEDLSLARTEFEALRAKGVTDFTAYFAEHESPAVDHVVRACIYGRGPASVRAYASAAADSGGELPQLITPEAIEGCKAVAAALAEGRQKVGIEVPMLDAENRTAFVAIQVAVQPGFEESLARVLVAYTDITSRESKVCSTTRRCCHAAEALERCRIGVWEWDAKSDTTRWSDAMLRIYGLSREEFTGRRADYADYTHPDDRESERESVRQSIIDSLAPTPSARAPGDPAPRFRDFRIRRKDGQLRWVRSSAVELVDDTGRPIQMQGVLWDITPSKVSELELEQSEQRFRSMAESAALPVLLETFDGEVIYANDSALEFFQIGRDGLEALRASDYWEDPAQRNLATALLAENGELRGFETRFRVGSEREPRVALMAARVIEYDGRNVILCHHHEITYFKCLEEQLTAGKLEAELQSTRQQERAEHLEQQLELCSHELRAEQARSREAARIAEAHDRLATTIERIRELIDTATPKSSG